MAHARQTLRELWDRVMPPVVHAARHANTPWTPDPVDAYCPRCGASAGPGSVTPTGCAFCRDRPIRWDRLTRLAAYDDPMDGWIKAMKFGRQWTWARWLGQRLAEEIGQPLDADRVLICPVPMPWLRRWHRGFNQARLMADALAKARGYPCLDLLRRTRHTAPQTTVAASLRSANVSGSLAARPVDLTGHDILLVDDVKTTGATLTACTRLLRQAGARSVHAAVAAVADPRGQHFKTK
ncbi:MAG: ComF family protein [Planctomycetota bacterium]